MNISDNVLKWRLIGMNAPARERRSTFGCIAFESSWAGFLPLALRRLLDVLGRGDGSESQPDGDDPRGARAVELKVVRSAGLSQALQRVADARRQM